MNGEMVTRKNNIIDQHSLKLTKIVKRNKRIYNNFNYFFFGFLILQRKCVFNFQLYFIVSFKFYELDGLTFSLKLTMKNVVLLSTYYLMMIMIFAFAMCAVQPKN